MNRTFPTSFPRYLPLMEKPQSGTAAMMLILSGAILVLIASVRFLNHV